MFLMWMKVYFHYLNYFNFYLSNYCLMLIKLLI